MHVQLYPTLRPSTGSADVSVLCVNVGDIMGKCITRGKWFNYCDMCIQGVTKLTKPLCRVGTYFVFCAQRHGIGEPEQLRCAILQKGWERIQGTHPLSVSHRAYWQLTVVPILR